MLAFLPLCTLSSSEPRVQPGAPMLRRGPSLPAAGAGLRGGGGDPASPDVGMANWASDYDRICWNESDPDIKSPLFVPKGTWTEEDFARVRKDPAFQDETSQLLIEREYRRLRGLPQTYDPKVEDPWDGLRGEGGASYWGSDPLEDVPGGTEGLKQVPQLRAMMQTLLVQVREHNTTAEPVHILSSLEALQQLKVCDLGAETRSLFPLREDEWKGPQFLDDEQRERAVTMLIKALTDFLSPDYLPGPTFEVPPPPPTAKASASGEPTCQIHVAEACLERARSRGVLPGDELVKPWIRR